MIGCDIYGTVVMKEDEIDLFLASCLENGRTSEEAIIHLRIIDTLLFAERLEKTAGVLSRKTSAGYYRKNSNFNFTMNKILEGAIKGAFNN